VAAIGLSRAELVPDGLEIAYLPALSDLDAEGNERTALRVFVAHPGVPFLTPLGVRANGH
jgi:stage V sporulation protein SpoVS